MTSMTRVIEAEFLKVRTVRNYQIAVAVGVLAVAVMAAGMAVSAGRDAPIWTAQPVALPLEYFAYVMMILGILMVTTDASSGAAAVMATLVPDRWRIDVSKYIVIALLSALTGAVSAVLVFVADWIGLGIGLDAVTTSEALQTYLTGVGAIVLGGVLGVALGTLLRSTSAALSLLLLWSFLVETVLVFSLPEEYAAYLPFKTIGGSRDLLDELGPWEGLLIFTGFIVVLTVVSTVVQRRRDSVVP